MTRRKYNKSRKSKNIQKGGELNLDNLKALEKDFEKLGYEFEESREEGYKPFGYVRKKNTDKPLLDKEITKLIESNLFRPNKIDSDDFIKEGNLLDCFKSGVKIDETLAKKLVENNYKKLFENRKGKITYPTHFIVKNKEDNYYLARFKGYHTMGRYRTGENGVQEVSHYIKSLIYRPFRINLSEESGINLSEESGPDMYLSIDDIEEIEYIEIFSRIHDRKKVSEAFIAASGDKSGSPMIQVFSDPNLMKYVKGLLGGKKSRNVRKTRKTRKTRKIVRNV